MLLSTALCWDALEGGVVRCGLCPHCCRIVEGATGICGVRENFGGELFASGYGLVSSVALDPIEKKPLYMFHPGKYILSIGGFGCNFRCPFCQNFEISIEYAAGAANGKLKIENGKFRGGNSRGGRGGLVAPEDVVALALQTVGQGNIGMAYTYNEPLIGYEFLFDCAKLVRGAGLHNVIVTNGYINREPLENLLPLIDAMNIDLKGFTSGFYKNAGGSLEAVKETIELSHKHCHVEVTTLVIPDENENDIEAIAKWLSTISPDIPLHLSRFFPRYKYTNRQPTPRETIIRLRESAKKHLKNVYTGNI